MMRILSAEAVSRALPMIDAIAAVRAGAIAHRNCQIVVPPRTPLQCRDGTSLVMPAYWPKRDRIVLKVVSIRPKNPHRGLETALGLLVLAEATTGGCLALMEAGAVTAIRTGAISGLATDLLARPDAGIVALFGVGRQARTQLEAVLAVRPIKEVHVVGRRADATRRFVEEMSSQPFAASTTFWVARSAEQAIQAADVIIAATTAREPLFDGRCVKPGTHVNAVGAFTPATRELDTALILRAAVFADTRAGCMEEAGDFLIPLREGAIDEPHLRGELGELVCRSVPGRESADQITVFKSVGSAVFDVAAAVAAFDAAERLGLGELASL